MLTEKENKDKARIDKNEIYPLIWNDGSGLKIELHSDDKGFIGDKPVWTLKINGEAITCEMDLASRKEIL